MAKGYPDFFGTSIWPKYGTPIMNASGFVHILDTAHAETNTITVQGVLTGIFGTISCIGGSDYIYVELEIDGTVLQNIDVRALSGWLQSGESSRSIAVLYDDRLTGEMYFVLTREIPFKSSFIIRVANESNVAIDVLVQAVYYVVT